MDGNQAEVAQAKVWKIAKTLPKRKEGYAFVYELCDPDTGIPFYVGQTFHPRDRCKQHFHDRKIYFVMRIVEVVPASDIDAAEQGHIRKAGKATRLENTSLWNERIWWKRFMARLIEPPILEQ